MQDEEWVAVFGMKENQDSVDGNPLHTYKEASKHDGIYSFEIEPVSPKIFIRQGSETRRWRYDKERWSEQNQQYSADIVLEYIDEVVQINMSDYLEHDTCNNEMVVRPPLITIDNHKTYKPLDVAKRTAPSNTLTLDSTIPNAQKKLVFEFDKSRIKEFEKFKHTLPRELNWLLWGAIPKNTLRWEGVFFNYPFGEEAAIDQKTLNREQWRLDPLWNSKLDDARNAFIALLSSWGEQSIFLTTREIKMYHPRFLHQEQDCTLQLGNRYGGGNPKLWHYFSLPKFLGCIQSKKMWFGRPSLFVDPFESKTNQATKAHQIQVAMRQLIDEYNAAILDKEIEFVAVNAYWAKYLSQSADGMLLETKFTTFDDVPSGLLSLAENRLDSINNSLLINCWHQNENESDAMWGLYSDRVFGITITSTEESIRKAFDENKVSLNVTPIEYHDLHSNDKVFDSLPVAYKHEAFEHEKECRVYLSGYPLPLDENGVSLPVKVDTLIDRIVLAPECPPWFKETVVWAVKSAGLNIEVEDSIFNENLY